MSVHNIRPIRQAVPIEDDDEQGNGLGMGLLLCALSGGLVGLVAGLSLNLLSTIEWMARLGMLR